MSRASKTLTSAWFDKLSEKQQTKMASDLANLCSPIEEASTIRGLLEETDSYTVTFEGKTPVAFKIGELSCPAGEEDPSNVGGRKRRSRGSRVKKQTRRTKGRRRNTVRK